MTDLENFVALYKSFGINCLVNKYHDGRQFIKLSEDREDGDVVTHSKKFTGYYDFYSTVWFTEDGQFIEQGFWE